MVATVLRTEEEKVRLIRPEASELYKIEKKHLIRYVNIGVPMDKRYGTEPIMQLNDAFLHQNLFLVVSHRILLLELPFKSEGENLVNFIQYHCLLK